MLCVNGALDETLILSVLYTCSKTIKHSQNQAVIGKLIKEVKSLNQSFDVADIRGIYSG